MFWGKFIWSSRGWSARLRVLAQLTIALHSSAEERAISKNLCLFYGEGLPEPSAMLSGTDRVARFSWSPRWAKPFGSLSVSGRAATWRWEGDLWWQSLCLCRTKTKIWSLKELSGMLLAKELQTLFCQKRIRSGTDKKAKSGQKANTRLGWLNIS